MPIDDKAGCVEQERSDVDCPLLHLTLRQGSARRPDTINCGLPAPQPVVAYLGQNCFNLAQAVTNRGRSLSHLYLSCEQIIDTVQC